MSGRPRAARGKSKPVRAGSPIGRVARINDTALVDRLIGLMQDGMLARPACALVGLSEGTLYRWLERGEAEQARQDLGMTRQQRIDDGEPPMQEEEAFRDFRERFYRARAAFERRMVAVLATVAEGGTVVEETRRTARDGTVEETTKYQAPDGKIAHLYLMHARGGEWAKKSEVAVTVDGGGGVTTSGGAGLSHVEVAQVSASVRTHIERAREQLAITQQVPEEAEIEDAVLVEEPERPTDG